MRECSKAMRRRYVEDFTGVFPWMPIFQLGRSLDVGCSDDKVPYDNFEGFDLEQGDANILSMYFKPKTFYVIHGSQIAEHLHNPKKSLRDWLTLLIPGGYLIITVPDYERYEGKQFPSRFNEDHKGVWSMDILSSYSPLYIHLPSFLKEFEDLADIKLCRLIDTNYDYKVGTNIDQTFFESDNVECFLEFVLQRK